MSIKILLNIYDLTKLNKFLLLHAIGLGAYHTVFINKKIIKNNLKKILLFKGYLNI